MSLPPAVPEHPLLRLRMPLAQIAREAGVSRELLCMVTRGHRHRPGTDTIRKLVRAFPGLSFDELYDWRWPEKSRPAKRRGRA